MRISAFLWVLSAAAAGGCGSSDTAAQNRVSSGKTTMIQWIDSTKDFGKINQGQMLAISFRFKNAGTNPLVIESVQPGCGCTVASFPKEPIAPGAVSEITGQFDSHGRSGLQHKVIVVKANTPGSGEQQVYFDVDVVKPGAASNDNN